MAFNNKLMFDLYVKTKQCVKGEIRQSRSECFQCKVGKYSSNVKEKHCRTCPRSAICPGKDIVFAIP